MNLNQRIFEGLEAKKTEEMKANDFAALLLEINIMIVSSKQIEPCTIPYPCPVFE
jgi:hypothetical protein